MRTTDDFDIAFVPRGLTNQCRRLIESYHALIGFSSLPDILWKAQLGTFIERHAELALLHRVGSRARSAKISRECYLKLATAILSLEVLASGFAGWSKIYPEAGEKASALLKKNALGPKTSLMSYYVYSPKYASSIAIATLTPPTKYLGNDG